MRVALLFSTGCTIIQWYILVNVCNVAHGGEYETWLFFYKSNRKRPK